MLDKNQEQINIGDYVRRSDNATCLKDYRTGIVVMVDKYSYDAENVLVVADKDGMPFLMPSSASGLSKAILSEDEMTKLNKAKMIFDRMNADMRFA